MDNNNLPKPDTDQAAPPPQEQEGQEKHPYHAPTLVCHGGLAELVQGSPGTGPDSSSYPDCTRS